MKATATRSRARELAAWLMVGLVCVAVAAALTGEVQLPGPFALRAELLVLGLVGAAAAPFLLTRWRTTFWVFLAWFMVEDLIRKYLGNDLRIYFIKDVLYVLLMAGLVVDATMRGVWRAAAGTARFWLYGLIAWSVVMAVPMAVVDWRIPVVALKLDWQYVPLVAVGFVLAREAGGLERLLRGVVALSVPASLIGIIQGSFGPAFLRPSVATPMLESLELIRIGGVFQPSGPFVDPGRFASMALVGYVASLALLAVGYRRASTGWRAFILLGVGVTGAAVWVNASKTNVLVALGLSIVAVFAPSFAERRPATVRAIATMGVIAIAGVVVFALLPEISSDRVAYLQRTLDPAASTNEWSFRFSAWEDNLSRGIEAGGFIGAGTGASSLGLQYLGEIDTGVDAVEGGFAAVAQQWGVVGLVLWLAWAVAWLGRQVGALRFARGQLVSGAGPIILGWMIYFLGVGFVQGFQGFQNYYANAYFWMFSGVVFALPGAASGERGGDPRRAEP